MQCIYFLHNHTWPQIVDNAAQSKILQWKWIIKVEVSTLHKKRSLKVLNKPQCDPKTKSRSRYTNVKVIVIHYNYEKEKIKRSTQLLNVKQHGHILFSLGWPGSHSPYTQHRQLYQICTVALHIVKYVFPSWGLRWLYGVQSQNVWNHKRKITTMWNCYQSAWQF